MNSPAAAPTAKCQSEFASGSSAQAIDAVVAEKPLGHSNLDDESIYAVAHHLYVRARYEEALPMLGFLVSRHPMERRFVFALAGCLQMLGRHALAIQHYLVATTLDPRDPVALLHSCECLIALGRVAEAREGLAMVPERCLAVRHDSVFQKSQGLMALIDQFSTSEKSGRTQ